MTITAGHFERSAAAILTAAEPADRTGTRITLDAARKAHAGGDHDLTGALLDEAACRANIIDHAKHRELFAARLAGRRPATSQIGEVASCGCPVDEGLVRHQRGICPDPVVAKLGWYFDGPAAGAGTEADGG